MPLAKLPPTTGTVRLLGEPSGSADALATIKPVRVGELPWLKMMTASAPAASALTAFSEKKQVPRWMSAMSAGPLKSSPAKSEGSQPLVDVPGSLGHVESPNARSTPITPPVSVPNPLPVNTPVS